MCFNEVLLNLMNASHFYIVNKGKSGVPKWTTAYKINFLMPKKKKKQ